MGLLFFPHRKILFTFFLILPFSFIIAKESELFKRAEKYYFQKKYEISLKLFEKILEETPDHARALSYSGDIYLIKKEYDKALSQYRQSVELVDNPAEEYFRIAQVYSAKKEYEKAKENYRKAYSLDPSITASLFQLGYLALIYDRDKVNTIKYWEDFVLRTPDDSQNEKIRKVIALLKDPNFKIPPKGSDISLEEALILGGRTSKEDEVNMEEKTTGHEKAVISNDSKGLLDDEDL